MTEIAVSIIVPTFNRPEHIHTCVQSFASLTYPAHLLEIIVVDDGSQIPVSEIIADIEMPCRLHVLRQDNQGVAIARNTGIQHAIGDLLVFTDDDCCADTQWVQALVNAYKQAPTALLGGQTINGLTDNIFSVAYQLQVTVTQVVYNQDSSDAQVLVGNNLAMSKHILESIGGFQLMGERVGGEDRELVDRWRWHEYPVCYVPSAITYHYHHLTFRKYCRQHWVYGKSAYYFRETTRDRQSDGTPFALTYYATVLKQCIRPEIPMPLHKSLRIGILLIVAHLTYTIGAITTLMRHKIKSDTT